MLQPLINKSRRALLRYIPPQVTRHLPAQLKGPTPIAGPPPGISIETLDAVCTGQLGGRIRQCAHQHIAGWKKHGTFRLYVTGEDGIKRSFIFKDEIYTFDEIPALRELSVRPGPSEYHVYTRSIGAPLASFLPEVFWHEEIKPGQHFRYLLEDLRLRYRRLHFRKKDLLFAVRTLSDVQEAMEKTLPNRNDSKLIHYNQKYSEMMIEYAKINLQEFCQKTPVSDIKDLIKAWPEVLKLHKSGDAFRSEFNQPIHGDYTLAHIHWKNGAEGAKIVDWEWAGIGVPHADLAALLKWAEPEIRTEAIRIFSKESDQTRLNEHSRLLDWCLLERKLLDASFFARQLLESGHGEEQYLRRCVSDVLASVRQ